MISEFQALSDKIALLAELTQSLRRENAHLRQSNATLAAEQRACQLRLAQAQQRVEALLASLPAEASATASDAAHDPINDDEAMQ